MQRHSCDFSPDKFYGGRLPSIFLEQSLSIPSDGHTLTIRVLEDKNGVRLYQVEHFRFFFEKQNFIVIVNDKILLPELIHVRDGTLQFLILHIFCSLQERI